ncbi:MAG: S-layer homology domain-containing protein [Oscillospiraceae bacterium]
MSSTTGRRSRFLWAHQTGVVAGTSDTTFDPDKPVTREAGSRR